MSKFRVKLRRVVYADVVVDASSATAARRLVSDDAAAWFVQSDSIDSDTVSVSSVEVEIPAAERRLGQLAKQIATVDAILADMQTQRNPDPDRMKFLRQQRRDLEHAITFVRDNAQT